MGCVCDLVDVLTTYVLEPECLMQPALRFGGKNDHGIVHNYVRVSIALGDKEGKIHVVVDTTAQAVKAE